MKISADIAKCAGEEKDGTQVCAYRDGCLRYVAPANPYQAWADFWKTHNDDCVQYISLPR